MKRFASWSVALGMLVLASCSGMAPTPVESSTENLSAVGGADNSKGDQDKITVWVVMKEQAKLAGIQSIRNWKTRGKAVHEGLQNHADASQADLRAWLKKNGVDHRPFWIVNTVRVTASQATIDEIAKRPDVAEIREDETIPLPPLVPETMVAASVNGTEWGLSSVRAPDAWQAFQAFGDDIVVANIDTGVQYDHPALVNQYRGRQADGSFNHNYNWYDPSKTCGNPSLVPCDNNNHGTHTMGTMVGDDGSPGENRIGVAPRARWIAAKGCEAKSCSSTSLLAAGQWILAPTDLNGQNPRTDQRPHIVNNSWGGASGSSWYRLIVQNWVAAGIFPAFSSGNTGPNCGTAGTPGDYPESFSAGGYDASNVIYSSSSRGPSAFDSIVKPNIAAPGVNVRSSISGSSYANYTGTSMASPHVAGSVALLWSVAPSLIGNIDSTRQLLSQTAVDTSDTTCGGTAANNNVWGEGKLDVYAALSQAPRVSLGTLRGTVTTASGGTPVAGATIAIAGTTRTASTDSTGAYQMTLPVASYTVTASKYGYANASVTGVAITAGGTTVQSLSLAEIPTHALSGYVRDDVGAAVAAVQVTILGTALAPATTAADGSYSFAAVADGEYNVKVDSKGCLTGQTLHVTVSADTTLDLAVTLRRDSFGYSCRPGAYAFVDANTVLSLTGDDVATTVALPFPFAFYGQTYSTAYVSTNGLVNFLSASSAYSNTVIPSTSAPNAAIYALWDDLDVPADVGTVRTELVGTAPNRSFVIEWRNVRYLAGSVAMRFELVLSENGQVLLQYATAGADSRTQGNSATIGIENGSGTVALQYSYNQAVLNDGQAILFSPPGLTPPALSAPTGVTATDGTLADGVGVSWDGTTGATSYEVYRSDTNSSGGAGLLGAPATSPYQDASVTPGMVYYYFVKACNSGGCSGFSTSDSGYRALAAPTGVTASDGDYTDKVQVSWTGSSGATSYQVYRNTTDSSSGAELIGTGAASPYDDIEATPGTTYYYFVKACSGEVCSDFGASDSGYRSAAPSYSLTGVTPNPANQAGTVTVTWNAPAEHSAIDWVAVAPAGAANTYYLTYQWVPAGTTGSLTFQVSSAWATGAYELRYFVNNTYQRMATAEFTVSGAAYSLTGVTPNPANQAGTVTVTWNAPAEHSAIDWVAVAPAGAANTHYLTYQWVPAGTTGSLTFQVSSAWATGAYELRYFVNNTYQRMATAEFTVSGAAYSLTGVTPNPANQAGTVTVTWNAPAEHSAIDWVAVAPAGAANTHYLTYQWVPAGTTGSLTFQVSSAWAAGAYELRYFVNNTYQRMATAEFTVSGAAYSLTGVTPNPANQAGTVTVTWNAPAEHSAIDWVAVAPAGAANTHYLTYQWVPAGTTGSLTFQVSNAWATGAYELRYFVNNTYQRMATAEFTVSGAAYTLTGVTPNPANQAGTVTVTWNAPAEHSAIDWVAVAPAGAANTHYLTYQWVPAGTTGSLTFQVSSAWAAGAYELRYFVNNTYQRMATAEFTVSGAAYSLTGVTPNPANQAGTVTVTWNAPAEHSAIDWVAVAPAGAANTQYLTYQWVPAGTTGSLTFQVSSAWATGAYELRYFVNNTYQRVGTAEFTVSSEGL